jgi:hypothetical protein
LAAVALPQAQAAGVSGQGTWETTLQGRDLDGNTATFEAYYDTALDITWLADANYAKTSGYASGGLMNRAQAQTWAAQLDINGTTGWRLPSMPAGACNFSYSSGGLCGYSVNPSTSEMAHLFYVTLGSKAAFNGSNIAQAGWDSTNAGPFSNLSSGGASLTYWADPALSSSPGSFDMFTGAQIIGGRGVTASTRRLAWAVHSGSVGAVVAPSSAVPEPQTYALALAGVAVAGALARKRRV